MTSGQDVSEYLDTFGLVKSNFFNFFEKMQLKKIEKKSKKNVLVLRRPEDEAISLSAGLLANPDMTLSHPSAGYDVTSAPVAMFVNSNELRAADFPLAEVSPL
jgi:hypothetical protein